MGQDSDPVSVSLECQEWNPDPQGINMPTTTAPPILMTAEEFVAQHENDRMELVNGVVVELPMPAFAKRVAP